MIHINNYHCVLVYTKPGGAGCNDLVFTAQNRLKSWREWFDEENHNISSRTLIDWYLKAGRMLEEANMFESICPTCALVMTEHYNHTVYYLKLLDLI